MSTKHTIWLFTLQSIYKIDFTENICCALFIFISCLLVFAFLELFAFTCPKVDETTAATHPRYADPEDCQYVTKLLICFVLFCFLFISDAEILFYSSMYA